MSREKNKFSIKMISKEIIIFNGEKWVRNEFDGNRLVFVGQEYVVKFDRYPDGDEWESEQCTQERKVWKKLKKSPYIEYFSPIIQSGKQKGLHYVVQKRVPHIAGKVGDENIPESTYNKKREVEKALKLRDCHEYNWGFDDNKNLLIFDYGGGFRNHDW